MDHTQIRLELLLEHRYTRIYTDTQIHLEVTPRWGRRWKYRARHVVGTHINLEVTPRWERRLKRIQTSKLPRGGSVVGISIRAHRWKSYKPRCYPEVETSLEYRVGHVVGTHIDLEVTPRWKRCWIIKLGASLERKA